MPSLIVPPHAGRTVFPLATHKIAAVSSNPLIRIAVPNKGSLSEAAAQMLREAGYAQRNDPKELALLDEVNGVEFFYLRPRDIAVYVGEGTLDVGITGRDMLIDSGADADGGHPARLRSQPVPVRRPGRQPNAPSRTWTRSGWPRPTRVWSAATWPTAACTPG